MGYGIEVIQGCIPCCQRAAYIKWCKNFTSNVAIVFFYNLDNLQSLLSSLPLSPKRVAWENSQHFTRSPLEPSQNNVWLTSAEIPYWWRAITTSWQCFWLVERKFPRGTTFQKHYQDLGSSHHQFGISVLVTQMSFCEGLSGDLTKRQLFSQATKRGPDTILCQVKYEKVSLWSFCWLVKKQNLGNKQPVVVHFAQLASHK